MAAPDSTKLQANFKLADGTLINIYASSQAELEAQLTTLQDVAELIKSTSTALGSGGNFAYAAIPDKAIAVKNGSITCIIRRNLQV